MYVLRVGCAALWLTLTQALVRGRGLVGGCWGVYLVLMVEVYYHSFPLIRAVLMVHAQERSTTNHRFLERTGADVSRLVLCRRLLNACWRGRLPTVRGAVLLLSLHSTPSAYDSHPRQGAFHRGMCSCRTYIFCAER